MAIVMRWIAMDPIEPNDLESVLIRLKKKRKLANRIESISKGVIWCFYTGIYTDEKTK